MRIFDLFSVFCIEIMLKIRAVKGSNNTPSDLNDAKQLQCYRCDWDVENPSTCQHFDANSSDISVTSCSKYSQCMVWHFFSDKDELHTYYFERKCASTCSPGCTPLEDMENRFVSCISCCNTSYCNVGNGAGISCTNFMNKLFAAILLFLILYIADFQMYTQQWNPYFVYCRPPNVQTTVKFTKQFCRLNIIISYQNKLANSGSYASALKLEVALPFGIASAENPKWNWCRSIFTGTLLTSYWQTACLIKWLTRNNGAIAKMAYGEATTKIPS